MRVVAAINGWPDGGALDARAAAASVATAWEAAAPGTGIDVLAVGDGGPRTADAWPGQRARAAGVDAVEWAAARWLAPGDGATRWDPVALAAALSAIAARTPRGAAVKPTVVVPLGDASPAGDAASLWGESLTALRECVAGLDIVALVTASRTLLGFHGMSAAQIEGHEGDAALAAAAQEQERRWTAIAREADAGARLSLMGPQRLSDAPGTGAAGGLAYVLAALGARVLPAAPYLAEASGLVDAAASADLVVAVGGDLTPRSLDSGVAAVVSAAAARAGVPATMLTTAVKVGRRDLMAAGLASVHESAPGHAGLADGIRRIAHTWVR